MTAPTVMGHTFKEGLSVTPSPTPPFGNASVSSLTHPPLPLSVPLPPHTFRVAPPPPPGLHHHPGVRVP